MSQVKSRVIRDAGLLDVLSGTLQSLMGRRQSLMRRLHGEPGLLQLPRVSGIGVRPWHFERIGGRSRLLRLQPAHGRGRARRQTRRYAGVRRPMIATVLPGRGRRGRRRRWLLLLAARQAQHLSRVLALQRHLRPGEGSPVVALEEVDALAVRPGVPLVVVPLLQQQREAEAARLDGAAARPLAAIAARWLVRLEEREVGLVGAGAGLDA